MVYQENEIDNIKTKFSLISSNNKKPIIVKSKNIFTENEYDLSYLQDNKAVRLVNLMRFYLKEKYCLY